ncbi:MAG: preprotein translocase subunit SecA [Calditrichia bacterium]|nr:preprotein translocase subunit SecA [Calditrichia bacterium]
MLASIITKIFGSKPDRDLKKIKPMVGIINEYFEEYQSLSEESLKAKTDEFKQRLQDGETTDDILPEAFAVVKEACRRHIGKSWNVVGHPLEWDMVPYDVQLIGGIVLHQSKIAEMATGEGKTLVAVLPTYLNALEGKGVHIVTVNDYLAQRDTEWMGEIHKYLGLTVGIILNEMTPDQRREAYNCDITYGTNNEFGFDYLRDNMAGSVDDIVQIRGHNYGIIDEVDNILVDEARTPLIISGPVSVSTHRYNEMKPLVERLVSKQYKLVTKLISEGESLLLEGKEMEAGEKFLVSEKGGPKHKRLLKVYQEPSNKKLVRDVENIFLRDKGQNKASEEKYYGELYYTIDEKNHIIDLTEKGRDEIAPNDPEMFLIPDMGEGIAKIESDSSLSPEEKIEKKADLHQTFSERSERLQNISQLLRAFSLYEKDVEYVVTDGKVLIVDEFTGRLMHGRRYSDGLHQAIEAKENVKIERETQTLATVTLQNYFRMYDKLAGMTGTAETEAGEFWEIYKLDVLVIPTNEAIRRIDYNDLIYRTKREKYSAVIDEIERMYKNGRPVLVGTISVEVSETLGRMLKRRGIKHNVLNAKYHQQEAEIVKFAGQPGAVTIATNMAGRGTDIKLARQIVKCSEGCYLIRPEATPPDEIDIKQCEANVPCGLHIIGTERHEARRIDRQLRGRSGRQGDPGSSRFFLCLEDDLMRLFGSDRIANVMNRMGAEEGEVIVHPLITKSIEKAQKRVEAQNFAIRKRLLEYDNVMNQQREVIYHRRTVALKGEDPKQDVLDTLDEFVENRVKEFIQQKSHPEDWEIDGLLESISSVIPLDIVSIKNKVYSLDRDELIELIKSMALEIYDLKEHRIGSERMRVFERFLVLRIIDDEWKDHLYEMDMLKEGIHLRAYGQKDPLMEYKREAYHMFESLIDRINEKTLNILWKFQVQEEPQTARRNFPTQRMRTVHENAMNLGFAGAEESDIQKASRERSEKLQPVKVEQKVGRNEPCPCGSGKKYKKCCGAV